MLRDGGADAVPTGPLLAEEDPAVAFSAAEFAAKSAHEVLVLMTNSQQFPLNPNTPNPNNSQNNQKPFLENQYLHELQSVKFQIP